MVPLQVLLVDDQPAALHYLRRSLLLAWPTCRIDLAGSAAQAEALLLQNQYDAVVTDYFLGDGTGLPLAILARGRFPAASIVLTSASADALAAAATQARAADINLLPKPLDLARLREALAADRMAAI